MVGNEILCLEIQKYHYSSRGLVLGYFLTIKYYLFFFSMSNWFLQGLGTCRKLVVEHLDVDFGYVMASAQLHY